jgi:malate dehydrogenase (oxaloacetate-decarboxylating)
MRKHSIDTFLRLKLKHRPGQLAAVAEAIASERGLLGEISTLRMGEAETTRDVAVETETEEQTQRVIAAVRAVDGCELLEIRDRVIEAHRGGKMHATSRVPLAGLRDLRTIYTPGVARVVRAIQAQPALSWDLTSTGNSVGIFTNGSRVLGLGNVGPLASMPVMEGKAVLYDRLAGISATPILVSTLDPEEFIRTVELVAPTFGGIHLEDIRSPDCYHIEEELIRRLHKPVMHDDQHGTATVALAALINASKMAGLDLSRAKIGQIGLGAAGSAIARLALTYGFAEVLVSDPTEAAVVRVAAWGARPASIEEIMAQADIVVAATGRPGLIAPSQIRRGQVIFSLSNPDPEIDPVHALEAGAAFASDGRSINNALAFPGIFRGVLEVRSRTIPPELMIAAARAIAQLAEEGEIVPSPLDADVHQAVAKAVAEKARELGLAGTAKP